MVQEFVYVFELQDGKYYVGKTDNVEEKFKNCVEGKDYEMLKIYKPIKIVEVRECIACNEVSCIEELVKKYENKNVIRENESLAKCCLRLYWDFHNKFSDENVKMINDLKKLCRSEIDKFIESLYPVGEQSWIRFMLEQASIGEKIGFISLGEYEFEIDGNWVNIVDGTIRLKEIGEIKMRCKDRLVQNVQRHIDDCVGSGFKVYVELPGTFNGVCIELNVNY